MFTGLVQDVGVVREARGATPRRLSIETALPAADFALGESIAVDGACLTVVARAGRQFSVEAAGETLARTTLGSSRPGDRVNLERAMALSDRLGGHLVLGHVDGVGRVVATAEAGGRKLDVEAPPEAAPFLIPKGSVTLGGVSLTINAVAGARFSVLLIPETLARTNLGALGPGAAVNVEADILGKYVARLLRAPNGLDLDRLRRAGFAS